MTREILYLVSGENITRQYALTGRTSLVAQVQEVTDKKWDCAVGIRIFVLTCTVLAYMYIQERA